MLNVCASLAFSTPGISPRVSTGAITVNGVVTVNSSRAASGQTIVSGSTIATEPKSELMLSLDNLARVRLEAGTKFDIDFSRSDLSGLLEDGSMQGFVPAGIHAEIKTADASVATDPREPAVFSIQVEPCSTRLAVQAGRVEIRAGNSLRFVVAGESFSTAESPVPAPQQNFNKKKAGVFIAIGATIGVLLIALTHDRQTQPQPEPPGSVGVPSPR